MLLACRFHLCIWARGGGAAWIYYVYVHVFWPRLLGLAGVDLEGLIEERTSF